MEDNKEIAKEESTDVEKEVKDVDYDKINTHINTKVETEVGKFIKEFIEANKQNQVMPNETTPTETEEERELKEWKI